MRERQGLSRASRRELIGAVAVIALGVAVGAVIVAVVLADRASAPRHVGDVDLQSACDHQYPGEARELVQHEEGNPYTWACESPAGVQGGIEVSEECERRYGPDVYASVGRADDPAGWGCVTDAAQPTGASSSSTTSASESSVPTLPANTT